MIGRSKSRSRGARAVVTGAGSGIGRAFALELAQSRKGDVVCSDVDLASAQATVRMIEASGGKALAVRCDVSSESDVRELAATSSTWFEKPVDLVVNNAGIGTGGTVVGEESLDNWRRTVDVNLWGVIHGCHVFTPMLRASGRGGIINVASAASFASAPRMSAYNVTKAGVLALSETLAAELSGSDIVVTVLCPTFVSTNIVANGRIAEGSAPLAAKLMKWTGVTPESIARTTLDAHDRGTLHVVPQLDARAIWSLKRAMPATYTRGVGALVRTVERLSKGVT